MAKAQTYIVNLPFSGFYNSLYSDFVDSQESNWVEWHCGEGYDDDNPDDFESWWPEPLQLDSNTVAGFLFDSADYSAAYRQLAEYYVAALDEACGDAFGLSVKWTRYTWEKKRVIGTRPSCRMKFESMDSPREYNFTTDRLYAEIPAVVMRKLFAMSKADKHATLSAVIKRRFTSYDGFRSGYSNSIAEWLRKPLGEWDHNELGTLLIAAMELCDLDPDDRDLRIYYGATEGADSVWDSCVNWAKFDELRREARAEKLEEWIADDPDAATIWGANHPAQFVALNGEATGLDVPYRCSLTPDMFAGIDARAPQ